MAAAVTDGAEPHLTAFPTIVELIGGSPPVARARAVLRRASAGTDPVLIVAEPGLDVSAVARAIHEGSPRAAAPFVAADCLASDAGLEERIFGPAAAGGTLALTNLQQLPRPLQARLARMLRDSQPGEETSDQRRIFDARVIAGLTGRPEDAMQEGTLRRDLAARFALRLELPPLRHRSADIPTLIGCLVGDAAASAGVAVPAFTREALTLLAALPWRRNFDELRDVLDMLVRDAAGGPVRLEDILDRVPLEPVMWSQGDAANLREARLSFERHYIAAALNRHRGRMQEAARSLGMQRTNLYRKVRQLGISLPRGK